MDEALKNQIVIGAAMVAGPVGDDAGAWRDRVLDAASTITAMLAPSSDTRRVIDSVAGAKVFTAVVRAIKLEQSSTRGLVTLETRVSEHSPDGTETARTERTDTPRGLAMARRLRGLKGHRVAVWVDVQTMSNSSNKVRVITHVEDLGEIETEDAE